MADFTEKNWWIPLPFSFVFWHTQRPILKAADKASSKVEIDGNIFPVFKTGGWNRDAGSEGVGENAGVLLINEDGAEWKSLRGQLA